MGHLFFGNQPFWCWKISSLHTLGEVSQAERGFARTVAAISAPASCSSDLHSCPFASCLLCWQMLNSCVHASRAACRLCSGFHLPGAAPAADPYALRGRRASLTKGAECFTYTNSEGSACVHHFTSCLKGELHIIRLLLVRHCENWYEIRSAARQVPPSAGLYPAEAGSGQGPGPRRRDPHRRDPHRSRTRGSGVCPRAGAAQR